MVTVKYTQTANPNSKHFKYFG